MEVLPDWPQMLGLPLNSGYKHTIGAIDPVTMTAGIGRVRRTMAEPVSEFTVGFTWDGQQIKQFRSFAMESIAGTAGWFVMPLWSGGGIERHTVRIKKANNYQLQSPYWSISFILECPERYFIPDEIGDLLLEWKAVDVINAGKIAGSLMCNFGSDTTCFGGWNVFDVVQATTEGQCNLSQLFNDWENC